MVHVSYTDIIIATIAAFLFSAIYYVILGKQAMKARAAYAGSKTDVRTTMTPVKFVVEVVRTFTVGLFIAYAVALMNFLYVSQALLLAFWLWIAFPVVLLVGSVMHERFPVKLAIIHAGDWLAKLLILCLILTLWR
jgi:hypothetical protein